MTSPSARQADKADQILNAARDLFLEQGYARTSTDAITQAAGVSKQTLYVYFPGKAELLAAVLTRELRDLDRLGQMGEAVTTYEEFRARLLEVARNIITHLLRPDTLALFRLLLGEVAHLPEVRSLVRDAIPTRLLGVMQTLLLQARERGLVAVMDPDLSARMFIGPVMSYVMIDGLMGSQLPSPPSEATLVHLVDLYLQSLTAGGTQP